MKGENVVLTIALQLFEEKYLAENVSIFPFEYLGDKYEISMSNYIAQKYYERMYLSIIDKGLHVDIDDYNINVYIDLATKEVVDPDNLDLDVKEVKSFIYNLDGDDFCIVQISKEDAYLRVLQGVDFTINFQRFQRNLYLEQIYFILHLEELQKLNYLSFAFLENVDEKIFIILDDELNTGPKNIDIIELGLNNISSTKN